MIQGIKSPRPGIVAIDLHRGHLDPAVATMPLEAGRRGTCCGRERALLQPGPRRRHSGVSLRGDLSRCRRDRLNPAWRHRGEDPNNPRKNVLRTTSRACRAARSCRRCSIGATSSSTPKKRYDCFTATDLDLSLRAHGVDTVLITGVNTNSCVIATATAACCRDFAVVVVSDCVDTMDGPELHDAALKIIGRAFGQVMTADEALEAVGAGAAPPVARRA